MWRVDHMRNGADQNGPTSWHTGEDAEDEALREASDLRFGGKTKAVAWFDVAEYVPTETTKDVA